MAPSRDFVATLVAHPSQPLVTDALIASVAGALGDATQRAVLASGIAADLIVTDLIEAPDAAQRIEERVRAVLEDRAVDVIVQPRQHRRKRLFLADMDSTMIGQECIDELADVVGLKAEVSEITERAMRGEIAFEPALRERVALLKNLPVGVIDTIIASRITLTSGGRELVQTMRANGTYTCLVSGGFTLFTGPISAAIGFHEHRSNELMIERESLKGLVAEPILGRQAKRDTLIELRNRLGLEAADTMATGDGANDLAMLEEAGLGVAFHAKPAVAAAAHARIEHADLSALLYCQGYAASHFAGP